MSGLGGVLTMLALAAAAPVWPDGATLASPSPRPSASPSASAASPRPLPSPVTSPTTKREFTNEDLPKRPSPSPGAKASAPAAGVTAPPPPSGTSGDSSSQEAFWRSKAEEHRGAIRQGEARIKELEEKIADLRMDRNPTNLLDPNREQTRQAEIAKAQAELESTRSSLAASRKALEDLEEEARRKNIPPGWLRER
jgi:hypothetical protein